MRFGNEKWWVTFAQFWLYLLGAGFGYLLKAYHQSGTALMLLLFLYTAMSAVVTLIERAWLYRKRQQQQKEEQKPVGPPPVSAAEDWIPQYPDDNVK